MTVLFENHTDYFFGEKDRELFEKVIGQTLEEEGFSASCEISLMIVDNQEIQEINRQFRRIDRATDVLSFPQLTFEEGEIPCRNEEGEILLGDIVISIEKAKEQAQAYGHSLQRELAFLTAHSMLHLLGYDHMEKEEEKIMFQKQEEILNLAGFPRK